MALLPPYLILDPNNPRDLLWMTRSVMEEGPQCQACVRCDAVGPPSPGGVRTHWLCARCRPPRACAPAGRPED